MKAKLVKESLYEEFEGSSETVIFDNVEVVGENSPERFQIVIVDEHGYGSYDLEIVSSAGKIETGISHTNDDPDLISVFGNIVVISNSESVEVYDALKGPMEELWGSSADQLED